MDLALNNQQSLIYIKPNQTHTPTHTHTRVFQKVLSQTQIFDFSRTSHFFMGLTFTELKAEIRICFFLILKEILVCCHILNV